MKLVPRQARTHKQICKLPRDNVSAPDWWMQLDEEMIYLTQQSWGAMPSAGVAVPRDIFDAFVAWYEHGTVPRKLMRENEALRIASLAQPGEAA